MQHAQGFFEARVILQDRKLLADHADEEANQPIGCQGEHDVVEANETGLRGDRVGGDFSEDHIGRDALDHLGVEEVNGLAESAGFDFPLREFMAQGVGSRFILGHDGVVVRQGKNVGVVAGESILGRQCILI